MDERPGIPRNETSLPVIFDQYFAGPPSLVAFFLGARGPASGACYSGLQIGTCPIEHDVLKPGEAVTPRNLRLGYFPG